MECTAELDVKRSVNCADLCDVKKRMKHLLVIVKSTFVRILHALLVLLLKLNFVVGYRSLSMFGV